MATGGARTSMQPLQSMWSLVVTASMSAGARIPMGLAASPTPSALSALPYHALPCVLILYAQSTTKRLPVLLQVELEDFVPAMNSDRYEERPLSADDKAAIAPYKLSKGELRNLLPQVRREPAARANGITLRSCSAWDTCTWQLAVRHGSRESAACHAAKRKRPLDSGALGVVRLWHHGMPLRLRVHGVGKGERDCSGNVAIGLLLIVYSGMCCRSSGSVRLETQVRFRGPAPVSLTFLSTNVLQDWDQINVDFFSNKRDENIPLPEFRLNILWMEKNLAVAIDQVYSRVSIVRAHPGARSTRRPSMTPHHFVGARTLFQLQCTNGVLQVPTAC